MLKKFFLFLAVLPKIDASLLSNREEVGHLFKGLIEKVRERLDDSHKRVQLAAAMCLYTLNECTEKVMNILQYHLEHGEMVLCFCASVNSKVVGKFGIF